MSAARDRFTIATGLTAARKAAGLTQQDVADAAGLSLKTLGNYERGYTEPSLGDACRWARAVGKNLHISEAEVQAKRGQA